MSANKIVLTLALLAALPVQAADPAAAPQPGASTFEEVRGNYPVTQPVRQTEAEVADYVAPTLYGLREILVPYPIFIDPRASSDCGLNRETLLTVMQRNLQDPNLDVMVLNETHERRGVRAELVYEVHSSQLDQTCLSWVSVRLIDKATLTLPPLKVPRPLTITYWQRSSLTRSPMDRHQTSVGDALAAIGRQFLRDVKLAEPAVYSNERPQPDSEEDEKAERQRQMMKSINESVSRRLINQDGGGADIPGIGGGRPSQDEMR